MAAHGRQDWGTVDVLDCAMRADRHLSSLYACGLDGEEESGVDQALAELEDLVEHRINKANEA